MDHGLTKIETSGSSTDLCGHAGTRVTEAVYRHQLRPVLLDGAVAMDRIFTIDASLRGR